MLTRSLDAEIAYSKALQRSPIPDLSTDSPAPTGSASGFGSLVSSLLENAASATQQAEHESAKAINRTGDLVSIASAVNNAELTLETVVAVRDRMISAYQDIIRMPI